MRTDLQHLLLIGAYRDNEVKPTHPLMRKLDAIRELGRKSMRDPLEVSVGGDEAPPAIEQLSIGRRFAKSEAHECRPVAGQVLLSLCAALSSRCHTD